MYEYKFRRNKSRKTRETQLTITSHKIVNFQARKQFRIPTLLYIDINLVIQIDIHPLYKIEEGAKVASKVQGAMPIEKQSKVPKVPDHDKRASQ